MNDSAQSPPARPALDRPAILRIMTGAMLAMLLGAMDQTIVAPALPTIGRDFSNFEYLSWVVTAYLVSATAVTPLYGKLSDIYGRRAMLLVAVTVFIVASVLCAVAQNMTMLVVGRFLQGLGGGGLIALPQTIVGDMVPPRDRPRYQAYVAMVFMTASIIGPLFGGLFAQHLHWSLIFWINLPIGVAALAMCWNDLRRLPQHHRARRLDVIGAVLMILATTLLLLALSWAGRSYAWSSWEIMALLAASAVAFASFVTRLMTAREPFIPLTVLLNPVVASGVAASFFAVGAMIGLTIFVPIYLEVVRGLTASQSGLHILALTVGTVVGAWISGKVMGLTPHYKRLPMVGITLSAIATATLAVTAGDLSLLWFEVLLTVAGMGLGTQFPLTTIGVQNAVAPHELGTATANLNFFRTLGSAVLVSVYSAVFLTGLGAEVDKLGTIDMLAAEAAQTGVDIDGVFEMVFAAVAVTLVLSVLALTAMKELPLRGAAEEAEKAENRA